MSRRMLLTLALLCGVGAAAAVAFAVRGAHGSGRPDLVRVSNRGVRIAASRGTRHAFHSASVHLLAARDGRAFYELDTTDGQCFGVGSSGDLGDVGGEVCPRGPAPFPSAARSTLDFSVYEGQSPDRDGMTLYRIEGFAADGVAAVGITNRAGHVALRVPVDNNVYVLSHVPPGLTGEIVALDAAGSVMPVPNE